MRRKIFRKMLHSWWETLNFAKFFQPTSTVGKFSQFKLQLKSMPEGIDREEYRLDKTFFENMENTDVRGADLNVELITNHHAGVYDMQFHITGEVTLLCDRCLDDLILPIDTAYHITVKYGEDYNDDSDDLLEIPESDNYLNVAYMIYDTVMLAIPIKHVHPLGKCNRAMSALLKKHRARPTDEDASLENELIDEMDSMDDATDVPTDPRWDGLKGLSSDEN